MFGFIRLSTIAICSLHEAYLSSAALSFTSNIKIISCVLVGRILYTTSACYTSLILPHNSKRLVFISSPNLGIFIPSLNFHITICLNINSPFAIFLMLNYIVKHLVYLIFEKNSYTAFADFLFIPSTDINSSGLAFLIFSMSLKCFISAFLRTVPIPSISSNIDFT